MQSVLIVEDSPMVLKVLRHLASRQLDFELVYATSRAEALAQLVSRESWLAAIVDLNLPDAPDGELVDDCLERGVPTIVLTGSVNNQKRDQLTKRGIVDYVLKEGRFSYLYAVNLVARLARNRHIKVIVAEDSKTTRRFMVELLQRHLFQVVEAEDGQQALQAILADPTIRILITDNNMPNLDGFELIHQLRHKHEHHDLVAIGLSSAEDKYLSAKFIKNGANDFLYKPFSHEEFFCRIMQAVDAMERLDNMRAMAYTDPLTQIGNRRFFIEKAQTEVSKARKQTTPLSMALIDIDYFKSINDEYGHDVGDQAIQLLATILAHAFQRFIVARTGGEEFSVLFPGLQGDQARQLVEVVREQVEHDSIDTEHGLVGFTISAGISQAPCDTFERLMKHADEALYRAKDAGRNMVVFD